MYCGRFCVFQILVREVDDKKSLLFQLNGTISERLYF